eukprot:3695752-Rhodomonas_salina.1
MEHVNARPFARSVAAPEANGRAHYENGTFHLYFAGGSWRLQSTFKPDSNGCWSYVNPGEAALACVCEMMMMRRRRRIVMVMVMMMMMMMVVVVIMVVMMMMMVVVVVVVVVMV